MTTVPLFSSCYTADLQVARSVSAKKASINAAGFVLHSTCTGSMDYAYI